MLGIDECCRICLGKAPPIHSVHISYKIAISKTISQVINECSSIQISEHDFLPKYICSKCYQQLLVVHDFRELILRSDCYLKQKHFSLAQSVDVSHAPVEITINTTESTLKDNLKYKTQTNADALEIKCEDKKNVEINTVDLNLPRPEDVCVKSEDSSDNIEFCEDNGINGTENCIQNNRCQTDRKSVDRQDEYLNDSKSGSQNNVKQEVVIRINPGRKPSTVSKSKRKVLEFKCDICSKVLFGRSNRLKLHIITAHSDIKNFECETCGKRFKSKQQLINHTRVHTGEKPYHCDICKKKFTSTQNLFNHKRKHTGQHKSYKCELCEKGYSTPGELETHNRIVHTGEKPFLCEICSRAYSSARNLGLHIRSVHQKIYDETEVLKAKLDILSKTNMIDYAIDIRKQLYPREDVPEDLKQRRQHVVAQLQELQQEVEPILQIMANEDMMKNMENMRDSKTLIAYLEKEINFDMDMINSLHVLAKYRYECGNYSVSTSYLYFCMLVLPPNDKNYLSALWGKFASEILVQNWDSALEDLNKLREHIDNSPNQFGGNSLQLLQQRTWLIHWSLFVFFNHAMGRELIIEMFLYRPHYLNAIQTMCPHILRYLATAVIINRGRRSALKDLVKVIQQESYTYRDPITEFLEHLYVNFDFDGARQKLQDCQTVLYNDFFLISCLEEFVENARLMIFETFCRIHQCISIGMLAEKLNMNPDEAECWIVNLIRNARLDAKIDSKLGHVVMGAQPLSPYQQLIEKVDSLSVRSETLCGLIDRKLKARTDIRWGNQEF